MSDTHFRPFRAEVAVQHVLAHAKAVPGIRRLRAVPPAADVQPVFTHQMGHPFPAHALPVQFAQLQAHPRAAVTPFVPFHYPADQLQYLFSLSLNSARFSSYLLRQTKAFFSGLSQVSLACRTPPWPCRRTVPQVRAGMRPASRPPPV